MRAGARTGQRYLSSLWQEQREHYEGMLEDGGAASSRMQFLRCFDSWQVERRRAEQAEARLPSFAGRHEGVVTAMQAKLAMAEKAQEEAYAARQHSLFAPFCTTE